MNERAQELTVKAFDRLIAQVDSGHSEALTAFLKSMASFHRYSMHNLVLISYQKPDATHVAGFRKWIEMGRHVKTGEKGIMILAPMLRYQRRVPRKDPLSETEEGRMVKETAEGFACAFVFDVSQTTGKCLPNIDIIRGDASRLLPKLQVFTQAEGINLRYVDSLGGADGRSRGGSIDILDSLSSAQKLSVLAHELAHEIMHQRHREMKLDKRTKEVEAESVAFVVAHGLGLDCGTASADYIHLYGGDSDMLLKSMGRIKEVSTRILRAVLPKVV